MKVLDTTKPLYRGLPVALSFPRALTEKDIEEIHSQRPPQFNDHSGTVYTNGALSTARYTLPKRIDDKIEAFLEMFKWRYKGMPFDCYLEKDYQWSSYVPEDDRTWHVDGMFSDYGDTDKPQIYNHGSVTMVIHLSTQGKDYKGGNLSFFSYHNIPFKGYVPQAGDICMFPCFSWHKVSKVTQGRRDTLSRFLGLETPLYHGNMEL